MHVQGSLPLQHQIASSVASSITHTPEAPAHLGALSAALADGLFAVAATAAGRSALAELRAVLFASRGREREACSLWQESLATAAYAELLSRTGGASVAVACLGGLLHRAGDASMLGAISRCEVQGGARLESLTRSRLSAVESAAFAARLIRDWKLSEAVARCLTDWRRCGELDAVGREAQVVYCGRLCALELLQPQFCVPGVAAAAIAEHGIDAHALSRIRASDAGVLALIRTLA